MGRITRASEGPGPLWLLQALVPAPHDGYGPCRGHGLHGFLPPSWFRGQSCSCRVYSAAKGLAEHRLQKGSPPGSQENHSLGPKQNQNSLPRPPESRHRFWLSSLFHKTPGELVGVRSTETCPSQTPASTGTRTQAGVIHASQSEERSPSSLRRSLCVPYEMCSFPIARLIHIHRQTVGKKNPKINKKDSISRVSGSWVLGSSSWLSTHGVAAYDEAPWSFSPIPTPFFSCAPATSSGHLCHRREVSAACPGGTGGLSPGPAQTHPQLAQGPQPQGQH